MVKTYRELIWNNQETDAELNAVRKCLLMIDILMKVFKPFTWNILATYSTSICIVKVRE